jgi:hypothetical protein
MHMMHMRTRILTTHERKVIEQYLKTDGEKQPTVRSLARYAKENLEQLRKDLTLVEKFYRAYVKKNGKG